MKSHQTVKHCVWIQFFLFQAEARLAARRQARYEARNIRMKELEKKQKEEEENQEEDHDEIRFSDEDNEANNLYWTDH